MQGVLLFSRYLQLCVGNEKFRVPVSNEWTVVLASAPAKVAKKGILVYM